MWLFSKNNFLSIVENHDDPEMLLVRARFRGDIEEIFPDAEVIEGEGTDYLFRAWVKRTEVADVLRAQVINIDYPNFKSANYSNRHHHLMRIWDVMYKAQENSELNY